MIGETYRVLGIAKEQEGKDLHQGKVFIALWPSMKKTIMVMFGYIHKILFISFQKALGFSRAFWLQKRFYHLAINCHDFILFG